MRYPVPYAPPSVAEQSEAQLLIDSQVKLLRALVAAMHRLGIKTWADVRAWKAQKILSEPLWKISEAHGGKYRTRYISVGAATYMCDHESTWQGEDKVPIEHDHIVDRAVLAEAALASPSRVDDLARLSVACLVLASEHRFPAGTIEEPWRKYGELRIIDCRTGELVDRSSHGSPRHWHDPT